MSFARFVSSIAVIAITASASQAQSARDTIRNAAFDSAYFAWEMGDYPAALAAFERILSSAQGDRFLERIALITGELYRTIQVAPNGQSLRWSADGRFAPVNARGMESWDAARLLIGAQGAEGW